MDTPQPSIHPSFKNSFEDLVKEALAELKKDENITDADLSKAELDDQTLEKAMGKAKMPLLTEALSLITTYNDLAARLDDGEKHLARYRNRWSAALATSPGDLIGPSIIGAIVTAGFLFGAYRLYWWDDLTGIAYILRTIGLIVVAGFALAFAASTVITPWQSAKEIYEDYKTTLLGAGTKAELEGQRSTLELFLKTQIREQLRVLINENIHPSYKTTFAISDAPGLSENVDDARQAIETTARKSLFHFLNNMPGGSIGISGPRGAGKSTLIQLCCGEKKVISHLKGVEVLPVFASAPVKYDSRDFIIYLFSSICQKVLSKFGQDYEKGRMELKNRLGGESDGRAEWVLSVISYAFVFAGLSLLFFGIAIGAFMTLTAPKPASTASTVAANTNTSPASQTIPVEGTPQTAAANTSTEVQPDASPAANPDAGFDGQGIRSFLTVLEVKPGWFASWGALLLVMGFAMSFLKSNLLTDLKFPTSLEEYKAASDAIRARWLKEARFFQTLLDSIAFTPIPEFIDYTRYKRIRDYAEQLRSEATRDNLAVRAQFWLDEMKFQQSYTSGWSGAIKLPIGLEGGVNKAMTLAQRQMSNPEVVDAFKTFLTSVSARYKVVIGIDELDKIESDEEAQRFLNEIKSIFGLPNCFYLISVSENAMSNFERRGLPFRDVFDSSFDNVVYVNYLDHEGARALLARRIIGRPMPFILLSYCFSGGLPRDLIRTFRNILEISGRQGQSSNLSALCEELVRLDLLAKLRAVTFMTKKLRMEPYSGQLIKMLYDLESTPITATSLQQSYRAFYDWNIPEQTTKGELNTEREAIRSQLIGLAREVGAYTYFLSNVVDYFGDQLKEAELKRAEGSGDLEVLARARQSMATDVNITVLLLEEFVKRTKPAPVVV